MKNILLIGDFNNILGNIYKLLLDNYRVQLCKVELNDVEGITEIVKPDLAIVSMYGVVEFDKEILEHFEKSNLQIPVIFIGSYEECIEYIGKYEGNSVAFLERPIGQKELLKKCKEMLGELYIETKVSGINEWEDRRKKILVVDDSGVFLRSMKALLEPKYEIFLAKSGKKGITVAEEEKPDLILLDYEMPEWDGKETLEQLRKKEETAEIPVIFLTGVSNREHIFEVLKMLPQGYILKPVDKEDLEKKIEEVI